MRSVYYLTFIVFLSGCTLTRHYKKVATDTDVTTEKKSIIAPWVSVNFPSGTVYVPGKRDTVEAVIYDEEAVNDLNILLDSLLLFPDVVKVLKEKCIPITKRLYITRVDTIHLENTAKIFSMQQSLARLEFHNTTLSSVIEQKDANIKKVKNQRNLFIGILSVIGLSFASFIYFKVKK